MAVKEPTPSRRAKAPEIEPAGSYKSEKPSPFSIEGIRRGAVASNIVKVFLVASGLIMAGGFIISSLNPAPELRGQGAVVGAGTTVAQVGERAVTGAQLQDTLARQEQYMGQFGQTTTAATYLASKQSALEGLTNQAAVIEAAKKSGVTVSDADVEAKINQEIGDILKPKPGQTEAAFRRQIESQYGSMDKAKADITSNITPEVRDGIRDGLYVEKLRKQVEAANRVTEDDYKRSVTKLKLYAIIVRPPLPKAGAQPDAKASEAQARARAEKIVAQLKVNPTLANFQSVAKTQSDDPQSKAKGGELGLVLPSQLGGETGDQLAKATTPLVGPIADASGAQQIFFIADRKTELPKDYQKNKAKLLADFEKTQDDQAWQKRQTELQKSVPAQIADPALQAYATQTGPDFFKQSPEGQKQARAGAIGQYQSALKNATPMEAAAINYQLAQLYGAQGQKPEQLAAFKAAVEKQPNDASLRLDYARALRDAGQPQVALAELQVASKRLDEAPSAPSMFGGNPDDDARKQLAAEFGLLKQPQLAAAERAKIKPQAPGGMGGFPGGLQVMPQSGAR